MPQRSSATPSQSTSSIRKELPSLHAVRDRAVDMHARTQRSSETIGEVLPRVKNGRKSGRDPVQDVVRLVAEAIRRPAGANGAGMPAEADGPAGASATVRAEPARPTDEQIRERAYHIYLSRHGAPGSPEDDWRRAEEELRAEAAARHGRAGR